MPIKRDKAPEKKPNAVVGDIYRHYKGGKYIVTDIAVHTETEEEMIVYKDIFTGATWVRPASMWNDTVIVNGKEVRRFEPIQKEEKR